MTAVLFAANRGLSVAQVGSSTEIGLASGLFDLLGIHPMSEGRRWDNPWAGMEALARDIPKHPYAQIPPQDFQEAFERTVGFFGRGWTSLFPES